MMVGDCVSISGCVTQLKYLNLRNLMTMEKYIGFRAGRLAAGAVIATLDRLPTINEFDTLGYSQVAEHRHRMPSDLDPQGIRRMAMSAWSPSGGDRLVKLLPVTPHDRTLADNLQYPPGEGIPQWVLHRDKPIPGRVVAVLRGYADALRI